MNAADLRLLPSIVESVDVVEGAVPDRLPSPSTSGVLWQAQADQFLLRVPDVARYRVEEGRRITLERVAGVSDETVYAFLRKTPLAALLFQRGMLALHASAVATERGAVVIAGVSSAGKSTLLAALLKRGYTMLSDDITPIGLNAAAMPTVYPTYPEVFLWDDAARTLVLDTEEQFSLQSGQSRHRWNAGKHFSHEPQPLRALYFLFPHHEATVQINPVEGKKRFQVLSKYLYNTQIADALFDRMKFFALAAPILQHTPMQQIRRPRRWCLDELTNQVEADLK